jgi:hypothetical protein
MNVKRCKGRLEKLTGGYEQCDDVAEADSELCWSCTRNRNPIMPDAEPRSVKDLPAPPHDDITKNKHKGNAFSRAANPTQSRKARDMQALYEYFLGMGPGGCTCEAAYLAVGLIAQTGSGRCSDLKRVGKIVGTGRKGTTRTGSSAEILVADVYAPETVSSPEPVMADVEEL